MEIKWLKFLEKIFQLAASIYNLQGLSGHADRNGLINWIDHMKIKPKKIFLVHGDEDAQKSFKELLDSKEYKSVIVKSKEEYKL